MKPAFRLIALGLIAYWGLPFEVGAQFVNLQPTTPGTTQTGHMNISGIGLFGTSVGIGTTAPGTSGLNVTKTFSSASSSGNAIFVGCNNNAAGSLIRGIYVSANNFSSGSTDGGYFSVSGGTGTNRGLYAAGNGNSFNNTYGVQGFANNVSTGKTYGGYFTTTNLGGGTGVRYGILAEGNGNSSMASYGVNGFANNTNTGTAYGGYFSTSSSGTGQHYGVYASGNSSAANTITYGSYGSASNTSSGGVIAGYFFASSVGSGSHQGVHSGGYGNSANDTYGVFGEGDNTSTGTVYGGYFIAASSGTGTHYGVYGVETAGGSGAAVYAAGDMAASGAKTAVVKTSSGHRLLYALESAEVWFDDYGQGRLVNGQAHVELDPFFLETVTINSAHPMKVFIQLTSGAPVPAVVEKGQTGFIVRAPDQLNATFDYRVVAKRKGYENDRLRTTEAGYDDPTLYPERWAEIEKKMAEERQQQETERERHEREQQQHQRSSPPDEPAYPPDAAPDPALIKFNEPPDLANDLTAPEANALIQNHPNPFNPATKIQFDVKQPGRVTLKIYNSLGQEVANLLDQNLPAGRHAANFDASSLPSGAYFYKLSVNGFTEVKKMELVK